ncbi:MAG: L-histidine N-alpha-methyltransferase, partial [Candidatus Binatia bacterium]
KVDFKAGETIHTESSHKYSSAQLEGLATRAGLRTDKTWSDEQGRMAVMLLAPA